jgi:hypothetical protein
MPRASHFLGTVIAEKDPEFREWAVATLKLWNEDPRLHADFGGDVVLFFDSAFVIAEELIKSAEDK